MTDKTETAADLQARITEIEAERDALLAEVAKLKKQLDGAAAAPKASRGAKPAKARKIAALDEAKHTSAADLLELIQASTVVEVAFSNGNTEIADLAPLVIAGDAWKVSLDRLQLNLPELLVHGPGGGKPAYVIAGYGLLLDGELVAYSARSEQLQVGANSQVNLKDDIIF